MNRKEWTALRREGRLLHKSELDPRLYSESERYAVRLYLDTRTLFNPWGVFFRGHTARDHLRQQRLVQGVL